MVLHNSITSYKSELSLNYR